MWSVIEVSTAGLSVGERNKAFDEKVLNKTLCCAQRLASQSPLSTALNERVVVIIRAAVQPTMVRWHLSVSLHANLRAGKRSISNEVPGWYPWESSPTNRSMVQHGWRLPSCNCRERHVLLSIPANEHAHCCCDASHFTRCCVKMERNRQSAGIASTEEALYNSPLDAFVLAMATTLFVL